MKEYSATIEIKNFSPEAYEIMTGRKFVKDRAHALRMAGWTYSDIALELGVPTVQVITWVHEVTQELTEAEDG